MSEINYQALREAAERAIPAMERLLMLPADDDLLSEQELKDYGVDIDALNAFKFLAGPETVLALLDERERNQQYIKSRDQENEDIALTVGKLRVELEAEKQRAKVLFMENARLKSGIAGLIHLGILYADVEVMKIAGDAQLSTPCTDSIISSIATGFASKESEMNGQISIVRPGACDDSEIRMIIRLAMGKTITALITPENLALALTGKSDLPVELKLRNVEIKVK